MKKSMKKLTLHRETLHSLEERKLRIAAGGISIGMQDPYQETGCPCNTGTYPPTACYGSCSCSNIPCR
jgi:hypothetical protein